MLDPDALRLLLGLGELAVSGVQQAFTKVSSLVSSNKSKATETQGPLELSPGQTEALEKFNKLSDAEKEETREQLREKLDTKSKETFENARMSAARQAEKAKQEQKELFNTSLPRVEPLRTTMKIPNVLDFNDPMFNGPYFKGLRQFQNLAPVKAQRRLKSDPSITPEALIRKTFDNYEKLKKELRNVQPEPSNPFLDFCYFMGDIPKPLSLFDISKGFLDDPLFKDLEKIFASVESKLLTVTRVMTNETSITKSALPADANPFAICTTETTQQTESKKERPAPKGPGPR